MKQILIVCLAVFSLAACKKESATEVLGGDKLLEIKTGDEYLRFQYNTSGKLVKAVVKDESTTNGDEVVFDISYGSAGQISEVRKSDGEIIRPVYDGNEMTRAEVYIGNEKIGHTDYEYLNGLLKSVEIKFTAFGDDISTMKFILNYDGLQRVQKTSVWLLNPITSQLEPSGYVTNEYDNKKNPLHEISDFMLLLWENPGANNITKETQYHNDNSLDEVREFTYTYSQKQTPTQATMKTTSGGQQSNTTINFKYQ